MRQYGAQSEIAPLKKVVVHVPNEEEFIVLRKEEVRKWLFREIPDFKKLLKEVEDVIDYLKEEGIEVIEIRGGRSPNQIYVRDIGIATDTGFLLGNFRYSVREGEEEIVINKLIELEIPIIKAPPKVIFEGGDAVFLTNEELLIGIGERTNENGYRWLSKTFQGDVIPVRLNPVAFHLDLAFNIADSHVCAMYTRALPEEIMKLLRMRGYDIIEVPQNDFKNFAINWLTLRSGRVLFYDGYRVNRFTRRELERRGIDVISVDITEITKGNGGIRCITLPILREY